MAQRNNHKLKKGSMENEALILVDKPQELVRRSSDIAGLCKEIVLKTAVNISGKRYVKCEGWQSIATAHGCVASARDVEKVPGGWRCIGELKRMSDGMILATAEGFVGEDETMWANRPVYAQRAMCQTRAVSRVCRSAFAHVVVLMDAGLSTTPAEEVPDGGFKDDPPPKPAAPPPSTNTIQRAEVRLESYKEVHSKPPGKWVGWFLQFTTDSGSKLEVGTFDRKIADNLDVLCGQECEITYRNGKKPGTLELCTIAPSDNLPP